jgi:hypothetical protein
MMMYSRDAYFVSRVLGAHLWGINGIFWGRVAADVASACAALVWASRVFGSLEVESNG